MPSQMQKLPGCGKASLLSRSSQSPSGTGRNLGQRAQEMQDFASSPHYPIIIHIWGDVLIRVSDRRGSAYSKIKSSE